MSLKVLCWKTQRVQDDSAQFPVEVVKNIRAWLEQTRTEFERPEAEPTPIIITLTRGVTQKPRDFAARVEYCVGIGVKEMLHFRHATVEILRRERGLILAKYRYLCARDQFNRVILGPQIRVIQEARIN